MHWRKAPSGSDGKVFYVVIAWLSASVAPTGIIGSASSRVKQAERIS
jgi:hypothetical protein